MGLFIAIFVILLIIVFAILLLADNKNRKDKREQERKNLRSQFGQFTSECLYDSYYDDGGIVLANVDEDKILIGKVTYKISHIEKCVTSFASSKTHTTYTEKQIITTNTGSTIGRAVVGGVLAGGVGAVIGGSTAQKEVKTVRTPHTTYSDATYYVEVDIKGLRSRPLVRAKNAEEGEKVCNFINDMVSSLNKTKEELQKKKIETSEAIDVEQWRIGLSKEEILKIDKGLDKIFGREFKMSESFCMAWSKKIGLKLPLEINCTLKNDHLTDVYINCSSTNRTQVYLDLMKFINFLNEHYGMNKSVDTDMTKLNEGDSLNVGKWSNSDAKVSVSVGKVVIFEDTLFRISIFIDSRTNYVSSSPAKTFISHNIDWQAITFGLSFNQIKEIDDFADYSSEFNVTLSDNYVSSIKKTLGLTKINRAGVELYKDRIISIVLSSNHVGSIEELLGDMMLLKDHLEKIYGKAVVENDVFDSSSWRDKFFTFSEWQRGTDYNMVDKALIKIYKINEQYSYFVTLKCHRLDEYNIR